MNNEANAPQVSPASRRSRTVALTETAILIAIILLMAYTPIGYIRAGVLTITLISIPVAIGAIVIGPAAGALLGGVFGITSFTQALMGTSLLTSALLQINPFLTLILCVGTRILAGWLTGVIFRAIHKRIPKPSYFIGGFAMPFLNTVFFMSALVLFFWNSPAVQESAARLGAVNPLIFVVLSISVNAVVEWISGTVVAGLIGAALHRAGFAR